MENELQKTCSCINDDVCPMCMDLVLDEYKKDLLNGKASKESIMCDIALKKTLRTFIKNEDKQRELDQDIILLESQLNKFHSQNC